MTRIARVRRVVRELRANPVAARVISLVDRAWWLRAVLRSGLFDTEFYAAQRGWGPTSRLRCVLHYVSVGFREGTSPNPLIEERFLSRRLPDSGRVPALYAYLVSDRPSVQVHPWLPLSERAAYPQLDGAWAGRDVAVVNAVVGGRSVRVSLRHWRSVALASTRRSRFDSTGTDRDLVVRLIQPGEEHLDERLASIADVQDAEVDLVAVGVEPSVWSALALAADLTGAGATRLPRGTGFSTAVRAAAETTRHRRVLTVDPRHALTAVQARRLLDAAGTAVAAPLARRQDGTLAGLGAGIWPGQGLVLPLRDHPLEHAQEFTVESLEVPLVSGRTFAAPARSLERVLDEHGDTAFTAELVSHLAGSARLLADIVLAPEEADRAFATAGAGVLPEALAGRDDEAVLRRLLRAAGLEVAGWPGSAGAVAVPRLRWTDAAARPQRWAIKTCAPAGAAGEVWGDAHFARGLARALRRLGHEVVVDAEAAAARPTAYLDDVHVLVRGPRRLPVPSNGVRVEWIISHPDEITRDEVTDFDHVFAVSPGWARRMSRRWGVRIDPLLECTDADAFFPRGLGRTRDIVFVGTARGIARPAVVAPLEAGIDVKVYGPDWRGFIPGSAIEADSIPNDELSLRYESAAVVLNDHWPAMRREGFMAMRPFDVVAAGGRVISESVDHMAEVFGPAVVTYDTPEQLVALLGRDPDTLFPDDDELAVIAERVRTEHSFDARARVIDDVVSGGRRSSSESPG